MKEIKVPVLGKSARAMAGISGIFILLCGIGISQNERNSLHPPDLVEPKPPPSESAIDFTILDELGPNEESEQVNVSIDSKLRGTLIVDRMHPKAQLTVTVPGPGRYSYQIGASGVITMDGRLAQYPGSGEGLVNVTADSVFDLGCDFAGNKWMVTLEQHKAEARAD